jgi:hypothetical protein
MRWWRSKARSGDGNVKSFTSWKYATAVVTLALAGSALPGRAAQLSSDARASIPKDVQQIIVVDYRAMQNSQAAMRLKDQVLPPELKRLETALKTSGMNVGQDADTLAFAAYRATDTKGQTGTRVLGVAQGQFQTQQIMSYFTKQKIKPEMMRNNAIYPMGSAGMSVAFLNQTTMVFGDRKAVEAALEARDGLAPNFLQNGEMMGEMGSVDSNAVWSLLDQRGTQTMMRGVLGEAAQLADYDTVKNKMKSARYTMDFSNSVHFDMAVVMGDSMTAGMAATLLKGVSMLRKNTGSPIEKSAVDGTTINSSGSTLTVAYSSSNTQFESLLTSPLFQSVVK